MSPVLEKKVIFAGCARDCEAMIVRVLANISRMSELFKECAFLFIENDSHDRTKEQIEQWCRKKTNARLISLDGLAAACTIRTIRLATARNHYLSLLRSEFHGYDYLFSLDCDEVTAAEINLDAVRSAIEFLDRDASHSGVFANSDGLYYDLWALRSPTRCPGDVWEELLDYALAHQVKDEEAYCQTFSKRIFSLSPDAPPLEVDSAFGGLGIYKVSSILRNKRQFVGHKIKVVRAEAFELGGNGAKEFGWQCCEHVSFNAGFRELGEKLFILPFLINCQINEMPVHPSAWREKLFDPRLIPGQTFDLQNHASWGKIGRNQPCLCGSRKRYKHCHGKFA